MNTALIYKTMTGHSKKISLAIEKELNIKAQNIKNKPILNNIDLLFIVGGIYGNNSLSDMINYIKTLNSNNIKKAVLLTSSTSKQKGQESLREILKNNGIEVENEEFHCHGNFLFLKMGHPNKNEINDAVLFVKKFLV